MWRSRDESVSIYTVASVWKNSGYGHWKEWKRTQLIWKPAKLCYQQALFCKDWRYKQWVWRFNH